MGSTTKLIIIGNVHVDTIADAIQKKYDFDASDVRVNMSKHDEEGLTGFILFPNTDPDRESNGGALSRSLFFKMAGGFFEDHAVFPGDKVSLSLGYSRMSVEIVTFLAKEFGGFVLENDGKDHENWISYERESEFNIEQSDLSKLKLAVLKDVPAMHYEAFLSVFNDPKKLNNLISALNDYENSLNASAEKSASLKI